MITAQCIYLETKYFQNKNKKIVNTPHVNIELSTITETGYYLHPTLKSILGNIVHIPVNIRQANGVATNKGYLKLDIIYNGHSKLPWNSL